MNRRRIGLALGPALFALIWFSPEFYGLAGSAKIAAGITMWMAVWWVTEPVHITVTALLPLVLFPATNLMPLKPTAQEYGNEIIFLFIGGFLFGICIERWDLHKRIALGMTALLGNRPSRIILGFMLATGFISMWISNTATAVMMTPVAVAVAVASPDIEGERRDHFGKALLIGVGYACSIGGLATLIGTPTNAIFATFAKQNAGYTVHFGQWMLFAFPYALTLLLCCWYLLMRVFPQSAPRTGQFDHRSFIQDQLKALGPLSRPEKRLLWIFGAVVSGWIGGSLGGYKWWPNWNDTMVALGGAILLFIAPSGAKTDPERPLMLWDDAKKLPWNIILLFGGGLALAKGFDQSGLALWMGESLNGLKHWPPVLLTLAVLVLVVAMSEVASNIATASMMMPVLAALASGIGMAPQSLLLGATLAASLGFGLPVANAANSIVYGSGLLTSADMNRAGFWLDGIGIILLVFFLQFYFPLVFG